MEGRTFTLEPGSFTITRPWQKHRVGNPNVVASRLIWLILDVGVRRPNQAWRWPAWLLLNKSLLRRLTVKLRHNEHPVWKVDSRLAQCFKELAAHCGRPLSPAHSTQLKILINELWVALAELLISRRMQLDESLSSTDRAVRLFLEELRSRSDEPWTLEAKLAYVRLNTPTVTTFAEPTVGECPPRAACPRSTPRHPRPLSLARPT